MDEPLLGREDVTEKEVEEYGRSQYADHRARVEAVLERLPRPGAGWIVEDAATGSKLIDVIEATADLDEDSARSLYVKLPNGYATVEFLRMLFAVSG